jgi:hypothetical protein
LLRIPVMNFGTDVDRKPPGLCMAIRLRGLTQQSSMHAGVTSPCGISPATAHSFFTPRRAQTPPPGRGARAR